MSTHKHIDIICVVIILLGIAVTVLFMNGEKLGLTTSGTQTSSSGMFTDTEMDYDWDTSDASTITLAGSSAEVDGTGAYWEDGTLYITSSGKYILTGSLTNGQIIITTSGDDKIWLLMDGASVNCNDGPALEIEQAGKVIMTLAENTENSLSSGAAASSEEKADGAVYSKDDLVINGLGSLAVSTQYKHGIVCNDNLVITSGSITVSAVQDTIHANDSVKICNADLTLTAGDDGISVSNDDDDALLYVESGQINVTTCYEGLEATYITIAGGDVVIYPADDGLNGNSDENSLVKIDGGNLTIINENGMDADGIDSNKDIEINGGNVLISLNGQGTNLAFDYGSENGGSCKINGGNLIACGGNGMFEAISEDSEQGFVMKSVSGSADSVISLTDADGNVLLSETIPCSYATVVVSAEGLAVGDTVTLTAGDTSETITVDNSSEGSFGGMGGMGNMGDMGNMGGMGGQPDNSSFQPDGTDGEMPDMSSGNIPNGAAPADGTAPSDGGAAA